jgi:hypothetical protein
LSHSVQSDQSGHVSGSDVVGAAVVEASGFGVVTPGSAVVVGAVAQMGSVVTATSGFGVVTPGSAVVVGAVAQMGSVVTGRSGLRVVTPLGSAVVVGASVVAPGGTVVVAEAEGVVVNGEGVVETGGSAVVVDVGAVVGDVAASVVVTVVVAGGSFVKTTGVGAGVGQTSTIQKPTSMRVGHSSPPLTGDVSTTRSRWRAPAPHVVVHSDQSSQSSTPQSCGHGCSGVGFGVGQAPR